MKRWTKARRGSRAMRRRYDALALGSLRVEFVPGGMA